MVATLALKLQKRNGLPITDSYCSDVQCAKMIAEIAVELESNLHDEIVAAKYISVMADSATDKGILENEAVCVRLLNEEVVCENHCVVLVEVENPHAEGVVAAINSAFETVLIENITDKLIAFTADDASVNMCSKNGVQARLRQHTPHLIDMWFMPHKLDLNVSGIIRIFVIACDTFSSRKCLAKASFTDRVSTDVFHPSAR